jgi:hydrogenase expression/formation protein HypE
MNQIITLQHGSGGEETAKLLNEIIFKHLSNPILEVKHDGAFLNLQGKLAFSTDSFVVSPIFFKGGNIGELAVNGTVNDLSMCGAEPRYLSLAFIIEEGFSIDDFETIILSIKNAAQRAGVQIVTGDTKVVERGKGDKIYINTAGIGEVNIMADIAIQNIRAGDALIINAPIASHGMAIMSEREGLQFDSDILSDTRNLNYTVKKLIDKFGSKIHFLRDATRGGLASILHEIVSEMKLGIDLFEEKITVENSVKSACEILGLDPVYVANEGVFACIADNEIADEILEILKSENPAAAKIGHVTEEHPSKVIMESAFGGKHVVHALIGEQLPRIC